MKRIAICGYTSSVGKGFIKRKQEQFEIIRIGRGEDADIVVDLRERTLKGDVDKLRGCDVLINLSAQVNDETDEAILDLINVNVLGALYLAEIAHQYQIPQYINMSSISATYAPDDAYYGYYAQSKKSAEEFLVYYCAQKGIDLCILRPASIYGEESFADHQKLLYGIINRVRNNETVMIYGDCDAHRNYIHIGTLSDILVGVIEEGVTGSYNVVNGKNQSLTEIVADLNRFFGRNSTVEFLKDKPNIIERFFELDSQIYNKTKVPISMGIYNELKRSL